MDKLWSCAWAKKAFESFYKFSLYVSAQILPIEVFVPGTRSILPQGHDLNKLGQGPQDIDHDSL
jgi:hypothetical protein